MTYVQKQTVSVTTDESGDATEYSANVTGKIVAIKYTKTDFDNGSTFTITTETTGQGLWTETGVNASKTVRPRVLCQDLVGSDLTDEFDCVHLDNERVKIVIASGGESKTGTFEILIA